jgi:hypothetical protein
MASFKNSLIAALALAACTSAVPLALDKRAAITNTVTVTEWTTVDVTSTLWVDEKPTPAVEAPPAAAAVTTTTAAPVVSSAPAEPAPVQPQAAAAAPAAPVAPVEAPAAFAAAANPSTVSSAPAAATSATPAVQAKTAGAASGSGPCEGSGNVCTGDVTHYDGGLGACGWDVNTNSDMSIALPYALMGTQSNGNPYCGRSLSIKASDGSIVTATVGDKCMGCTGESIDLTDVLFEAVVPNGDGRVSGIQWWFN